MAKILYIHSGSFLDRYHDVIKITKHTFIKRGINENWYLIPNDATLEGL